MPSPSIGLGSPAASAPAAPLHQNTLHLLIEKLYSEGRFKRAVQPRANPTLIEKFPKLFSPGTGPESLGLSVCSVARRGLAAAALGAMLMRPLEVMMVKRSEWCRRRRTTANRQTSRTWLASQMLAKCPALPDS